MTLDQAKEIIKTVPKSKAEIDLFKKALDLISHYYLKAQGG